MKKQKIISIIIIQCFLLVLLLAPAWADWQKLIPPPDVDKFEHHGYTSTNTCYCAAAANMLAGLGYGDGNDVQERADDIYDELVDHYGTQVLGWADTAMIWWLGSPNNTWKQSNPYKIVSLYGEPNCKSTRAAWANQAMPKFIGNELRRCNTVRLSIIKPGESCGHGITVWGDSAGGANLTDNPANVKVADSDYSDADETLQTYTYDDYNDNNAWYINYNFEDQHWYVDNVVMLSNNSGFIDPTQPIGVTKKFAGSYRIHQNNIALPAQDLHYKVLSGKMYHYKTNIDWDTDNDPDITENGTPPTDITVDWDLSDNPVPFCTWVTINTEVILPWVPGTGVLNAVSYDDVYFTYPFDGIAKPDFGWQIDTHDLMDFNDVEPNSTGGYVVGAFDLYSDPTGGDLIGQYRLLHEYDFSEDPEHHDFLLIADPQTYFVGNFRFGHSYAYLDSDALWQFTSWMSDDPPIRPLMGTIMIPIAWPGQLLPYPKGQDYTNPVPQECGDPGTYYVKWDVNRDCQVNFGDFAEFAVDWMKCTDPNTANCP